MNYLLSLLNLAALFGALAALQALLLNRMRLAFAAMTAFLGLGAYGATLLHRSTLGALSCFGGALLLGLAMGFLSNRLRHDYFLVATLALLECLVALASSLPILGGREGLALATLSSHGGPNFEYRMAAPIFFLLALCSIVTHGILNSSVGIAIDRFRENQDIALRWFPTIRLRYFSILVASVLGTAIGIAYAFYQGRVTPNIFSIDSALLVLLFTVLAGKRPFLAPLAALFYWVLPLGASALLPFSQQGVADGIRATWGILVVAAVVIPAIIADNRKFAVLKNTEAKSHAQS